MTKQEIINKLYLDLSVYKELKLDKSIENHINVKYKNDYSKDVISIFQKYANYDIRIKRITEINSEKEDIIFLANYVNNKNKIPKCLFLY